MKGAQEQDHLLFELGRLGEQMVEKNQEFGALMEKLSLTSRALQVAEEKIEHLEAVDKQRNHHFKELQHQCAQHEKEQREVSHNIIFIKYISEIFWLNLKVCNGNWKIMKKDIRPVIHSDCIMLLYYCILISGMA